MTLSRYLTRSSRAKKEMAVKQRYNTNFFSKHRFPQNDFILFYTNLYEFLSLLYDFIRFYTIIYEIVTLNYVDIEQCYMENYVAGQLFDVIRRYTTLYDVIRRYTTLFVT